MIPVFADRVVAQRGKPRASGDDPTMHAAVDWLIE